MRYCSQCVLPGTRPGIAIDADGVCSGCRGHARKQTEIDRDLGLQRIISHQLINDLHGIWVDDGLILTMLTGKDALVVTDMAGAIVDHFCVGRDLTLFRDDRIEEVDWRFVC